MKAKRYLVTAALPYANGPKHIGHLAGAYIPADVYARYLRLKNEDVLFVCGSDEHGTAIPNQSLKEQTTPQAIIDKYHALSRDCFHQLGISFDIYHRTSTPLHHKTAQDFFLELHKKGLVEEETSEQYFDAKANLFLADRYITGQCPKCGFDKAFGDQCEKCGSTLSPRELINPVSTLTGQPPELRPTKHWYLPLQKYESWLSTWILKDHKHDWKTNVYGQCKSWIDAGLQSRAMTRDLDWGVKVPLPDAEGKVLYVWFDAPIGYISATRAFFEEMSTGKKEFSTPQRDFGKVKEDDWKKYWSDNTTHLVHFIGKDNIVFHCIIFPIMLKLSNTYILPTAVPANEFMNLESDKMSTSRKWSVEMHEYLADFPTQPDVLRYVLLTNLPETKDSEFTWKDFQLKNNSELVAIFGNFVNRALVLTEKYFDGCVPQAAEWNSNDQKLWKKIRSAPEKIGQSIEAYRFREATALLIDVAREGNKYLTDQEPWKLTHDLSRMGTILHLSLQVTASLSILCEPFLPFTAEKLRTMLHLKKQQWHDAGTNLLTSGLNLGKTTLLFDKIENETIEKQMQKLMMNNSRENTVSDISDVKPEVSFDEFMKMDIRIGEITAAERVEKSKKILKLNIHIGNETRTVMSGIGEHYTPEEIIGKQVTLIVNLVPRKIMGVESQGMILMSSHGESFQFLIPSSPVAPGAVVS